MIKWIGLHGRAAQIPPSGDSFLSMHAMTSRMRSVRLIANYTIVLMYAMSTFTTYLGICLAGHLLLPWDRGTQEALLQDLGWQLPHAGKGTKQPFPASCCKKSTVMLAMVGNADVVLECTSQMWSWTVSTFGLAEVL